MSATDEFVGEIVSADFEPEDHITVTIKADRDTRIGHWPVRVERLTGSRTITVVWDDSVLERALACFKDYQEGNVTGLPGRTSDVIAATIDCLRAVLDQEEEEGEPLETESLLSGRTRR